MIRASIISLATFMKKLTIKATLYITAVIIIAFFLNPLAAASVSSQLVNVRYSSSKKCTRIVFDLSKATRFKKYLSDDQQSLFIELLNCDNAAQKDLITLKDSFIDQVKIDCKKNPCGLLIRISLEQPAGYKLFTLKPDITSPYRLVVDFSEPKSHPGEKPKSAGLGKSVSTEKSTGLGKSARREKSVATGKSGGMEEKDKKRIVVIDPGHGGVDPGAVNRDGTQEKDIVLQIARELKNYLEQRAPYIQVHLTRDGDYFIPLRNRIKIAQKYRADLFISIHTNASTKKEVHGASVFYISETGASDKASDLLAARENSSDLIAGVKLSEDKLVNTILIDLVQTYTINESIQVCNATLKGLLESGFQSQGIRCANFAVLKSPSIPSALLEVGYITNQHDEEKLLSKKIRQQIALNLAQSVMTYLPAGEEEEPMVSQSSETGHSKAKAVADTQL
jgi:N-acetylmuramoyl-L-alanine amidase